jgi:mannobiose 2-epimerase
MTDSYIARIERELLANILPFWCRHSRDSDNGGFVVGLTNDLQPISVGEKGALLTARILWTFSAAVRHYGTEGYRAMADYALADLRSRFADDRQGGYFWSTTADGSVQQDKKQTYGQAFAIYALSEYYAATGDPAALADAIQTFRLVETHARDAQYGGYLEALDRNWRPITDLRLSAVDLNEPKSQNTHLHLMEAYSGLLRVWPDSQLRAAQERLIEVMLQHLVDRRTHHLGMFFSADWTPRSDRLSYGHEIEAAWLFSDAGKGLGDATLQRRLDLLAVKIAETTLREGLDADGGVFNQGGPNGPTDRIKEWWPQAEAVVGFLNAFQISNDQRYLQTALRSWDFIEHNLVDRVHGEWFRGVDTAGRPLEHEPKIGFWKCPYHNGRAALEAIARLRQITPAI